MSFNNNFSLEENSKLLNIIVMFWNYLKLTLVEAWIYKHSLFDNVFNR